MNEMISKHFNWGLPVWGALGAIILVLPELVYGNDAFAIFATMPLAVLIGIVIVVIASIKARRDGRAVLGIVCTFLVLAWALFQSADFLRTTARWLVHSKSYKALVLDQPTQQDGGLKHIEWDGWGFPGAGNTIVYLVLDPSDRLAVAAKKHSPGRYSGIPCEVVRVHRLERNWYTVLFYTETAWNDCG